MDLRVIVTNNGAIEKAIKRVRAAEEELHKAASELEYACATTHVQIKEAASAKNTDGNSITP